MRYILEIEGDLMNRSKKIVISIEAVIIRLRQRRHARPLISRYKKSATICRTSGSARAYEKCAPCSTMCYAWKNTLAFHLLFHLGE